MGNWKSAAHIVPNKKNDSSKEKIDWIFERSNRVSSDTMTAIVSYNHVVDMLKVK